LQVGKIQSGSRSQGITLAPIRRRASAATSIRSRSRTDVNRAGKWVRLIYAGRSWGCSSVFHAPVCRRSPWPGSERRKRLSSWPSISRDMPT
jgi:hypothetical protein